MGKKVKATHAGVFVGDLHMEKGRLFLPQSWDHLDPIFTGLDKVTDYMRTNGLDHMVLGGDLCDSAYPDQKTIIRFMEWIEKHPWIVFDIILGNHDFASTDDNSLQVAALIVRLGKLKNVRLHMKGMDILTFNDVPFCFMPHPYTVPPKTPYAKVNVAHFELTGAKRDNGLIIKDAHVLPKSKDYYLIGHLHTYQQFSNATYSGTLDQKNYGEPLPKGFVHFKFSVTKDDTLKVWTKFVEVDPPYKLITLRINSLDDLAQITDDPTHFYKLLIKKGVPVPAKVINSPQVMKHAGWTNQKELETLEREQIALDDDHAETFDPTHGLKLHLRKDGLSKAQAKLGVKIIEDLLAKNPDILLDA